MNRSRKPVPVEALNDKGEIVARFPSQQAAGMSVNMSQGAIRWAIYKGGKCAGYRWRKAGAA